MSMENTAQRRPVWGASQPPTSGSFGQWYKTQGPKPVAKNTKEDKFKESPSQEDFAC